MRVAGALILAIALLVAALAVVPRAMRYEQAARARSTASQARQAELHALAIEPRPLRPEVGFASKQRLTEHYRKHGREFGAITMDRYLRLAQGLRDRPPGGLVLEGVNDEGLVIRYDQATGAFIAFERGGTIRTFFRPARGDAYFRSQLAGAR